MNTYLTVGMPSPVQQQSGLQNIIATRHDSSCASLDVQASTVQAMMSLNDRVVSEVRTDKRCSE